MCPSCGHEIHEKKQPAAPEQKRPGFISRVLEIAIGNAAAKVVPTVVKVGLRVVALIIVVLVIVLYLSLRHS
jgi:hypothetical protein